MATMNDYLFVNPFLHPPGGGEGVANWMLEVLASRGRVTVLCWDPPNFEEIDRYYGTSLAQRELNVVQVAPIARRWLQAFRIPHHLVKTHWLERRAKAMRPFCRHCFSAFNDLDLGSPPAVQYVHHPSSLNANDGIVECAWPHSRLAMAIWPLYLWGLQKLSGHNLVNIRNNISIANSHWTARAYKEAIKGPIHAIIYPPPLGAPKPAIEGSRREAFITIARVDRSKNWPALIEIMGKVRERGHQVRLTLAGSRCDDGLLAEIQEAVERHADWLSLHLNEPREALDRLVAEHKYAIHGMVDEHYGMAVAELVLSGCLTFVHDSGGQVEIVSQRETRYTDIDDAVEKIHRVLSDSALQQSVLTSQAQNRKNLTRDTFVERFGQFIDALEEGVSFEPIEPRPADLAGREPSS